MTENTFVPLNFQEVSVDEMVAASRAFYQDMKRRRTVRQFADRPAPLEVIENCLLAAGTSPSGANLQPWHFAVVSDPEVKRRIREAAEEEERTFYNERASEEWLDKLEPFGTDEVKPFLVDAPYLIVIFLKKFTYDEGGNKFKNYYTSESVGIATGVLITALHLSGLATLTHTPSPMKFLNAILDRPDDERPYLILVTGYPSDEARVPQISKRALDQIATFY
jgi:nitroreductase